MGKMLDRKRPYGTVIGDTRNGVYFTQDGFDFNNKGVQVLPSKEPEPLAVVDEPKPYVVEKPSPLGVTLPSPEPEEDEDDKATTLMPPIKNWTKAAVINHIKMKFPGEFINERENISVLKDRLRNLYAADRA